MRRFAREQSLTLVFGALFLVALGFQALAGYHMYNEEQLAHDGQEVSFGHYITSSSFGNAVLENWQSEYLQFALFVLATIYFVQRGSPESKELHKPGRETRKEQQLGSYAKADSPLWARVGGIRTFIYSNSLLLAMGAIFVGSWFAQSVTGWTEYNSEQQQHNEPTVSWIGYLGSATFWESTLQNWQSEFLAIGSMAILAVYLRQRGSPESKPVGAPHDATGIES